MSRILLIAALICAVIAALIGFDVITATHAAGWLAASLALYFGSLLA